MIVYDYTTTIPVWFSKKIFHKYLIGPNELVQSTSLLFESKTLAIIETPVRTPVR